MSGAGMPPVMRVAEWGWVNKKHNVLLGSTLCMGKWVIQFRMEACVVESEWSDFGESYGAVIAQGEGA